MVDSKRIELNIIDLTATVDTSKEDAYSFDSQLKRMREEDVKNRSKYLSCPFCKDKFSIREIAAQIPENADKSFIECPHCASMIEVWIKRD